MARNRDTGAASTINSRDGRITIRRSGRAATDQLADNGSRVTKITHKVHGADGINEIPGTPGKMSNLRSCA